ncbi:MAG: hypothetical protein JKY43_02080 [Phycisphaerales bacterium]|nr:hypothetical protein [Phycisphaerales bacterium]
MSDVEIIQNEYAHLDGDVMPDVPARVISSLVGLMGFFTALLVGLVAGNPGVIIVLRALLAMAICAVIGRIIGTVGEICVREFLTNYKKDRPKPVLPEQLQQLYKTRADDDAIREQLKKAA